MSDAKPTIEERIAKLEQQDRERVWKVDVSSAFGHLASPDQERSNHWHTLVLRDGIRMAREWVEKEGR